MGIADLYVASLFVLSAVEDFFKIFKINFDTKFYITDFFKQVSY